MAPRMTLAIALAAMHLVAVTAAEPVRADEPLVVHEWGTFTCLRDDDGTQLPGINVDDETLPAFVHNLRPSRPDLLAPPSDPPVRNAKGVEKSRDDVTLRLETPVIYFYPPPGQTSPLELDVHVDFRAGWLTEFYPRAEVKATGVQIDPSAVGSLTWRKLRVGTSAPGPTTEAEVWNLPRQVQSAGLTAESGESEKYLFYRGVGAFSPPLWVDQHWPKEMVSCRTTLHDQPDEAFPLSMGPYWLVHVRPDGKSAFRELPSIEITERKTDVRFRTPREFPDSEYSDTTTDRMSASMHAALVHAGLFEDEAAAMLATWRRAYLDSPGLRLFFLVPRTWIDRRLPLTISQPAQIERVMMARIELVSPEQRVLLARLRQMSDFDASWFEQARQAPGYARLAAGRSDFGDLGVPIPLDFQAYLDLGRFRSLLLVREVQQRPSKNLQAFIDAYHLQPRARGSQ